MYSKVFLPLHGMQLCLPFCVDKCKIIKFQNWWSKKLYGGKKVLRKMSKYWDWYKNLSQHYSWSCKLRKQTLVDTDGLQTQQNEMQEKLTWDFFFFFWKPCCTHMKSLWFTWWFVFFINTTFTHTHTHTVTHTQSPSRSLNIKYTSAVSSRSDWCDESVKLLWQLMMTSVCVCLAFLMHCRFLCFCSTTGVCSLKVKDKSCERSHHWNKTSCHEMVWIFMIQVALM